jgi:membrane fusion protein, copper/silver efflux system
MTVYSQLSMARSHPSLKRLAGIALVTILLAACQEAKKTSGDRNSASGQSGASGRSGMQGMSDMKGMQGMSGMNASRSGAIPLTANQIRQFGVTFATVDQRPLSSRVRTVGTVMSDETKLSQITPRVAGYVERLYVDQTGQRVRKGQPLIALYSPDLVAAQQELLIAARLDTAAGAASGFVDASRRRLRAWGVSDDQIDHVLQTGVVEHTIMLYSPASGVVLEKKVVQGQAIQAGDMLLSVADLSDVWVDAALREMDATSVRIGSRATVEFTGYPGRPFTGRVGFVYPTVQGDAHSITARVVVPNPDGLLKPGMYATVNVDGPSTTALSVPTSAILNTGEHTLVFVDMGGGSFMPRDVTTGRVGDEYTEVLSGVDVGQRVVTSAQYLLDSESNLAEVMKSMIGQMGASDMNDKGPSNMKDMPGMSR